MDRVILESPYAGDVEVNLNYLRLCMRDCLMRGEAPFASHGLYTQLGVLDDCDLEQRAIGIEAGLAWGTAARKTVIYIDRGISRGMRYGIERASKEGRLVEYRTLHPIRIVTITGSSGAGKTSIIKKLLAQNPLFKLVISFTTRTARSSDLPGEYQCGISNESFEFWNKEGKFLWLISAHGNSYGTLKDSVVDALIGSDLSFMPIVPDVIKPLRDYADAETKLAGRVLSFYILSPPEEELRRRLKIRGEDDATIEKRVGDCKQWDEAVQNSGIPYIFITNEELDRGVEKASLEILKYLGVYDPMSIPILNS